MADEENVEQKQQDAPKKTDAKASDAKDEKSDKKSLMAKILSMLIILIVAAIGAAGGFTTARVVAGKINPQDPNNLKPTQADKTNESNKTEDEKGVWYYQHEPLRFHIPDY